MLHDLYEEENEDVAQPAGGHRYLGIDKEGDIRVGSYNGMV